MNPAQARQLIKDTFTQTFDKARFHNFAVNLLNHVDEDKKGTMAVPDAFAAHVKSCQRLATYADPQGERLDVLIVHLTEAYKIERTRTALRDFVAHKLKRGDSYKEAALVAFVPPDAGMWRLSYVRMQYESVRDPKTGVIKPEERPTPARRFSYLVGEGESCHTAQTRFLDLLQDTAADPTLAQIEEAFSVEAVTKEFFAKYAELFGDISAALEKLVAKDKTLRDEFKAKGVNTVDFAKKLMGQIVFLYFLQKKGWLGVERGKDWGAGPRDFLRRLARGDYGKYDNFFNDRLEPLFYDTLATDRGHDAWCNRFKCRIPFLNGGLFEPLGDYDWKKTDIILPDTLFINDEPVEEGITGTGVLDVFDRYNFTVNEAEPLEKEVAIDPEMLGKVFENLIEENRRKGLGAYYTPREIVHYMCQESLINYLDTAVNGGTASTPSGSGRGGTRSSCVVPRADIETLVRQGEQISHYEAVDADYKIKMPKSIEKNARALDEALQTITVCDPAVGSGAFPVGMMTEIVRVRSALTPYFNDVSERNPYHFKRHAIQNCLYGVDIDSSAVDIAKLRLWLSLVVDEEAVKQVKPLPNLDYKIVVGNSLIELLSSANLHSSTDTVRTDMVDRLKSAKDQIFDLTSRDDKKNKRKEIERLFQDLFEHDRKKQIEGIGQQLANIRAQGQLFEGGSRKEQSLIDDLESSMEGIRQIEMPKPTEHFEWGICFSEVFQGKRGFDVVIANPPYVRHETISDITPVLRQRFTVGASRADLLVFFYEEGVRLLRPGGVLTLITSNKFYRAAYGAKLRPYLTENLQIKVMIDFGDAPVFEAIAYASIFVGTKGKAADSNIIRACTWPPEIPFTTLEQTLAEKGIQLQQKDLNADGWGIESPAAIRLLEKLRTKGTPLGDVVDGRFYRGIITGLNEAFVIDRVTRDRLIREDRKSAELIRPFLRGRDVKRWGVHYQDLYLIVFPFGFHRRLNEYSAILRHLSQFEHKLKKRGQCTSSRGNKEGGQHHWLELDNNPKKEYIALFEQPKIVYPDIARRHSFAFEDNGYYSTNTTYFIPFKEQWLCGLLNSLPLEWFYRNISNLIRGGFIRAFSNYIRQIPIPAIVSADKTRLTKLAIRAAEQAKSGDKDALRKTEREIDEIVYRLFELTPAEIAYIEKSLANTDREGRDDEDTDDVGE